MIRPVYLSGRGERGFGEWDAVRGDEIYDDVSDVWEYDEIYELGVDELPEGVEDIRGLIHIEPDHVYYIVDSHGGSYVGTDDALTWDRLEVTGCDGSPCGTLGEMVAEHCANLESIRLGTDGSIEEWPQHFVAGPDEDPNWDTPREPVDWFGFREALQAALKEVS